MSYSPEADAIIAALGKCKTLAEVDATARKEARAVHLMSLDPKLKVRAIHIKNMAAYQRNMIRKDLAQRWQDRSTR